MRLHVERKGNTDEIIKNLIDNKYVNKQIVKWGEVHAIATCDQTSTKSPNRFYNLMNILI